MYELEYKQIKEKDKKQVLDLMEIVINSIERSEFYIKDTEEDLNRMFEKDFVYNYGAYNGHKLVGMTQLYLDQEDLKEYKEMMKLDNNYICDLGTALVLKDYRNQGIMKKLISLQKEIAKDLKFEYMITMAHPENIASVSAITKSGFVLKETKYIQEKFLRNLYELKL